MDPVRKIFPGKTGSMSVEIEPGAGNLSAKAYFAAIVGPQRLVFGKNTSAQLTETGPATQLVRNAGRARQWAYVAVALPGNTAGPKVALFSSDASIGYNTAIPVTLQPTIGAGGGSSFSAVLMPGEMLFARSAPGQGSYPIVISVVWF